MWITVMYIAIKVLKYQNKEHMTNVLNCLSGKPEQLSCDICLVFILNSPLKKVR
jgi:hypothetical protein